MKIYPTDFVNNTYTIYSIETYVVKDNYAQMF